MKTNRAARIAVSALAIVLALFFLAPLLWFVFAPFDSTPSLTVKVPERFSLDNFSIVLGNDTAVRALLVNSPIISGGVMLLVAVAAALAAYGLSRGSLPVLRPGIMVVAILAFVGAWGSFLTPLILIRNQTMRPAAIAFYQFFGEEGNPNIPAIAAYALLYTLPVLLLYLLINWRYGFRFFGGVKS